MSGKKLSFKVEGHIRLHLGSTSCFYTIGSKEYNNAIEHLSSMISNFELSKEYREIIISQKEAVGLGFYKDIHQINSNDFNEKEEVRPKNTKTKVKETVEEEIEIIGKVSLEGLTAKKIITYVLEKTGELITNKPDSKKPIIKKAIKIFNKFGYEVVETLKEVELVKPKEMKLILENPEETEIDLDETEIDLDETKDLDIEIIESNGNEINSNGKIAFEGLTAKKIISLVYDKTGFMITNNPTNKKPIIKKATKILTEKGFDIVDQHNNERVLEVS